MYFVSEIFLSGQPSSDKKPFINRKKKYACTCYGYGIEMKASDCDHCSGRNDVSDWDKQSYEDSSNQFDDRNT